jgi:hypothetical protein
VRAGLLSDARVVALLRTMFIPCHLSALNTPECMADARDASVLEACAKDCSERFQGGEREAFLLPDGTIQEVFMSLHGTNTVNHDMQMTAAGRRAEDSWRLFRHYGFRALRELDERPAEWDAIWDGKSERVAEVLRLAPGWPAPAPGAQALRVFVRNSYHMYDDLHGCELAALPDAVVAGWCERLKGKGDKASLPPVQFRDLVRAMVPRGQVATTLADESIEGELLLEVTSVKGGLVQGTIAGSFAMLPKVLAEVGRRPSAACMFSSRGELRGRFTLDRELGRLRELRAVACGVDITWSGHGGEHPDWFAPSHTVALEWVATKQPEAHDR